MAGHEPFAFHTLEELSQRLAGLGLDLDVTPEVRPLLEPVKAGALSLSNRLVVLPMEGADGMADGSPDALTFRRYERFAAGGAGLLWMEATAVVEEGRANPRQLWLHEGNVGAFAALAKSIHRAARQHAGTTHRPVLILQLTHSGRYSRPGRSARPIIAHHSPFLDPTHHLSADYPLITDAELEQLEDRYVAAARCVHEAGFDGVDIKACHRYLVSELLASHTRPASRYGGSFENRSRFFRNVVTKVRAAVPGLIVTSRFNAYDAMAHPYGFGVDAQNPAQPDLAEPSALLRFLQEGGAPFVNVTIGNPYFNPHVNRPFDLPTAGGTVPSEHPLTGVIRFAEIVRDLQSAFPGMLVVGGGYSWLRQFFPQVTAALVRRGWVSLVGVGRMALAYPDLGRDLEQHGALNPNKVCVTCSACTQIMRDGGRTGCVPRDSAVYEPIYKAGRAEALDTILRLAKTCRQCNDPACVGRCPAQVNIPRFVGQVAAGRFSEAYETIRQANTLAAICGYVCPSETLCESACINQHYSESVPVRQLQKWVSRKAVEEGWAAAARPTVRETGHRVAVLGGGPAGMAALATLSALGHAVTLFDRDERLGGLAQSTIPAERLPDTLLRQELEAVLASAAVKVQLKQVRLDGSYGIDQILNEGYSAAIVALGLTQSVPLPGAVRPKSGVVAALDFLANIKRRMGISGAVLVLGGGNTAMDAALGAQRAGADEVTIVYRRSYSEMPAWPQERDQVIHAGINIMTLTSPLTYLANGEGVLVGLKVIRTRLGAPDARGRRAPQPILGSEQVLSASLVVEALGQKLEDSLRPALTGVRFTDQDCIWTNPRTLETSRAGVFAAGDIINGGTTVVQAVAEGTLAARQVDAYLAKSRKP